jgi:hypothetical protein
MVEDASTAQAREMLGSLEGHLVGLARKLERVEQECNRRNGDCRWCRQRTRYLPLPLLLSRGFRTQFQRRQSRI